MYLTILVLGTKIAQNHKKTKKNGTLLRSQLVLKAQFCGISFRALIQFAIWHLRLKPAQMPYRKSRPRSAQTRNTQTLARLDLGHSTR